MAANPHLSVTYLGHLDYAATDDLFRQSDIVAIPSQWPEPLGAVAIEAMSAGAAVVASNIGGLDTALVDNHNGLLVDPHQRGRLVCGGRVTAAQPRTSPPARRTSPSRRRRPHRRRPRPRARPDDLPSRTSTTNPHTGRETTARPPTRPGSGLHRPMSLAAASPTPITGHHRRSAHNETRLADRTLHKHPSRSSPRVDVAGSFAAEPEPASVSTRRGCESCFHRAHDSRPKARRNRRRNTHMPIWAP